jgi:hypothetical protein
MDSPRGYSDLILELEADIRRENGWIFLSQTFDGCARSHVP